MNATSTQVRELSTIHYTLQLPSTFVFGVDQSHWCHTLRCIFLTISLSKSLSIVHSLWKYQSSHPEAARGAAL
jgi:hypothetical protein